MVTLTPEDWTLQALNLAAVAIYAAVGWIVWHRHTQSAARLANRSFAAWWLGLALLGLVTIPSALGWNVADSGLLAWRLWIYTLIPIIYAALGGLLYYLLYIYTGRHGVYKAILAFYILMMGYLVWVIEAPRPFLTTDEAGTTIVDFATPTAAWVGTLWGILIILPVLAAAIAYGALFFRTKNREKRYRIGLVSLGIIVWFSFSFISTIAGVGSSGAEAPFWQQAMSQSLGLLAAVMALFAFAPPARLRDWFKAGDQPAGAAT